MILEVFSNLHGSVALCVYQTSLRLKQNLLFPYRHPKQSSAQEGVIRKHRSFVAKGTCEGCVAKKGPRALGWRCQGSPRPFVHYGMEGLGQNGTDRLPSKEPKGLLLETQLGWSHTSSPEEWFPALLSGEVLW